MSTEERGGPLLNVGGRSYMLRRSDVDAASAQNIPLSFLFPFPSNSLAFPSDRSDESSCASQRRKVRKTNMTSVETTTNTNTADKAANVAAQAAQGAPEKAA